MIVEKIIQTTELASEYLDDDSRRAVVRFIRSRWNPDGGVRGRDERSDLYYTVFAAICMRALHGRMPLFRLWRYVRSFGDGASLDLIHLFCLVRLRSAFPMRGATRQRLLHAIDAQQAESPYDMFFKVVMAEFLQKDDRPEARLLLSPIQSTPNLAAAIVVNHQPDPQAETLLMQRYCQTGGFCATAGVQVSDLLSTATALFALRVMNVDLGQIRDACFEFVELLWRESGGFAGHQDDPFEDTEYTFYALLSIGCLME